ncbi:MAG TPA: arylsulfotransferase family protein, partial [Solirubrobacteraceae bacterium]|nr:arylsulfotransferase family protein [Solirubrobacteraceae bacterium]
GASGAVALAAHSSVPARASSPRALDVLPFPATPDAAPGTNIDLPAASRAQVQSVIAVGSRSGLHPGRLSAQPAGNGTAFTPNRPFSPGERVSVTATFRSAKAGTASGAPGKKQISFSFSVARAVSALGKKEPKTGTRHARIASTSSPLTYSLVTQPDFHPPIVTMSGNDTDPASGDIFLDSQNTGQKAAYILNPQGALLWYDPLPPSQGQAQLHDVRVQSYRGHPVLTFWQGGFVRPPGGGRGEDLILNHHYQTIHTITAGNGYQSQGADLHEFVLGHEGSEGTAFISVWSPVQADLTSVGGPSNGTAFDWIVQEIDVATDKVIWEWHALGHIPIKDSYLKYTPGQAYDYFHLNSIQQLPDGNILISSRHTWAVYLINKKTGNIVWQLGGKHSTFNMGAGTSFAWQHDASIQGGRLVTLFDDGAGFTKVESQSRGLEIQINRHKKQATLVHQYLHSPPTLASSQGSVQVLPDGNVFVGWGSKPYFSEYTPSGTQIFSGSFVSPVASYRAYRYPWFGKPLQPPAIAVTPASTTGEDNVYASWNGATQVASWQLLSSSSSAGPFTPVGSPAPWSGFETEIQTPTADYFEMEALDSHGHVLGTSVAAAGS